MSKYLLLGLVIGFLVLSGEVLAEVNITVQVPINDTTIADATPDLNFTTDGSANITYSWDGDGNISGCRGCTYFNTTYGENNGSDANLTALWHFNDNYGSTLYDDSTNNLDGTISGASWTTGKFGNALSFNGVDNGDYVEVPNSESLNITGNMTIVGWIYPTENQDGVGIETVVGKQNAYSFLYDHVSGAEVYDGVISIATPDGWKNGGGPLSWTPLNQWHHFAGVFNGTHLNTYKDGVLSISNEIGSTCGGGICTVNKTDNPLWIGRWSSSADYFMGKIDEIAIYNRSLSSEEILELYNGSLSDGQHNVTVYANDTSSNLNSTTVNFTVDATYPLISYNPSTTSSGDQTQNWTFINVSITETNIDTVYLNWQGSNESFDNNDGTNWWGNKTGLPDATYTFYAWVNDTVDNSNQTSSRSVTVDTTPPQINITSPVNNTVTGNNTQVLNVNFNGETVNYTWYNINNTVNSTHYGNDDNLTVVLPTLEEGTHNVTVYANDSAGNLNSSFVNFTIAIPPQINITSPVNNTVTGNNTQVLNVNFNGETVNYTWYNINNTVNSTHYGNDDNLTVVLPTLEDGTHNITVYANDSSGNLNSSFVNFTIDTTPPQITINLPANATFFDNTPTLNATEVEPNPDTMWYSVDSSPNITGTNTTTTFQTNITSYWFSDSSRVSGLGDIGWYATPSIAFNVTGDGNWTLIAGSSTGEFYGFYWNGTGWSSDSSRTLGLSCGNQASASMAFNVTGDGNWTFITGEEWGTLCGFYWNGTGWSSDSSRVSGLGDIGWSPTPSIAFNVTGDGNWTLIAGNYFGTFNGFYWNGTGWSSDSSRVAGLPDFGSQHEPAVAFNVTGDGRWTLIAGEQGGEFYGFYWNGTGWSSDSSRVSGLGDIGDWSAPSIAFNVTGDGNWTLIAGNYFGTFNGYYVWPELSDGPHNVTVYANDSAGNLNSSTVYFTVNSTAIVCNSVANISISGSLSTTVDVCFNASVSGASLDVAEVGLNPSGVALYPRLGNHYLYMSNSSDLNSSNVDYIHIRRYYTDAELGDSNLYEYSLYMSWYNEGSGSWERLTTAMDWVYATGVDRVNNYVWANVTHFSVYGISGEVIPTPTAPSGGVMVGGGGGFVTGIIDLPEMKLSDLIRSYGYSGSEFYIASSKLYGVLGALGSFPVHSEQKEELEEVITGKIKTMEGDQYQNAAYAVLGEMSKSQKVVIARGDLGVDAIVAVAFARAMDAPILLVKPDEILSVTNRTLNTLDPGYVVIVGGTEAVSDSVREKLPTSRRVGGKDRYETAVRIAEALMAVQTVDTIVITDSENPDPLAVMAAVRYKAPILYAEGDELPSETEAFLEKYKFSRIAIAGISKAAEDEVRRLT